MVEIGMNNPESNREELDAAERRRRSIGLGIVVVALVIWCALIAWGTLYPQVDKEEVPADFRKPLFVIGTIGTFLMVWMGLLFRRSKMRKR